MVRRLAAVLALAALAAAPLAAQAKGTDLTGTWRVDAGTDTKNGPREVIIRADSSASWGKEIVRWRVKSNKIWIALGGEWEIYDLKAKKEAITLSGGGLQKAVTLKRVGPPSPRPANVKVPEDPDLAT